MHQRTEAALEKLRQVEWFRNVGVKDTDSAEVLNSWVEAIEHCSSLEWENLCQEAVNQYLARLQERSPDEYRRWNDVVASVRPIALSFVREKTSDVIAKNKLPKVFLDTVNWDILHLCMEGEFADVYPPGFYASQAYWYASGHFPCGWRGTFPRSGNRIIY
jgi:hypothetical protein